MSNIKVKAKENLRSAEILMRKKLYSSSVHCLYYSCFQLAKYILNEKGIVCYRDQNNQQDSNSHDFIINSLCDNLRRNKEIIAANDFFKNIQHLKRFRKRADYQEHIVTKSEADELVHCVMCIKNIYKDKMDVEL